MFFFLSTIFRAPLPVTTPMSPVWKKPSESTATDRAAAAAAGRQAKSTI
jgi:hypothetical protein